MNEDSIAGVITLIVMTGWAIHFMYFKPQIFSKSKRYVLLYAIVSFLVVSMTMQILYKLALMIFS